jgi:hypothetical protein
VREAVSKLETEQRSVSELEERRRKRTNTTPLLEQEGWPKTGVVVRSKWFEGVKSFV